MKSSYSEMSDQKVETELNSDYVFLILEFLAQLLRVETSGISHCIGLIVNCKGFQILKFL
jgi:hypothetical protein